MEEFLVVLKDALSVFIQAMLAFLIPLAVRWLYAQGALLWGRFKAEHAAPAEKMEEWAKVAVVYAEQMGALKLVEDKLDAAQEVMQQYVYNAGYKVDMAEIRAYLENAVVNVINGGNYSTKEVTD